MRLVLIPILALACATPAVAAPSESGRDMAEMAEKLNDPATQSALSGTFGALLGAFLDIRVDGIAKALEPMNGGKRIKMKGNTVREIASRKDPRFEQKLEGSSRAMIGGLGAMASAVAVMMPQLEDAMSKVGDVMDKLPEAK
jgi:hypothetical protein